MMINEFLKIKETEKENKINELKNKIEEIKNNINEEIIKNLKRDGRKTAKKILEKIKNNEILKNKTEKRIYNEIFEKTLKNINKRIKNFKERIEYEEEKFKKEKKEYIEIYNEVKKIYPEVKNYKIFGNLKAFYKNLDEETVKELVRLYDAYVSENFAGSYSKAQEYYKKYKNLLNKTKGDIIITTISFGGEYEFIKKD